MTKLSGLHPIHSFSKTEDSLFYILLVFPRMYVLLLLISTISVISSNNGKNKAQKDKWVFFFNVTHFSSDLFFLNMPHTPFRFATILKIIAMCFKVHHQVLCKWIKSLTFFTSCFHNNTLQHTFSIRNDGMAIQTTPHSLPFCYFCQTQLPIHQPNLPPPPPNPHTWHAFQISVMQW